MTDGRATARGALTLEQLELVLRALPCQISYADEHDVLRYWQGPGYRSCDESYIDRDLRECHPPASLPLLERLIAAFRDGARDVADGWHTKADGSLSVVRYIAVRDDKGAYRGILEVHEDAARLRSLAGDQDLPGW